MMTIPEGQHHYTMRRRTWAQLIGGRLAFRMALVLANLLLLHAWGPTFAGYATAMGTSAFLTGTTAMGVEKVALKLAPRDPTASSSLISALLCVLLFLVGASALVHSVRMGTAQHADIVVGLAGTYAILLGANQALIGMHRAVGNVSTDYRNHVGLTVMLLVTSACCVVLRLSPVVFLSLLAAILLVADLLLAVLLPARPRVPAPAERGPIVAAVWQMSVGDVVPSLIVSWIFFVLDASGHGPESSALYLTLSTSTLALSGFAYVLRLVQPRVSLTLVNHDEALTWRRTHRWLRWIVPAASVYLLALAAGAQLVAGRVHMGLEWLTLGLFLACTPVIFAMSSINYVLENATTATLRVTAWAGIGSLLLGASAGALLVPRFGVLGAVLTMAVTEVVHGALIGVWPSGPWGGGRRTTGGDVVDAVHLARPRRAGVLAAVFVVLALGAIFGLATVVGVGPATSGSTAPAHPGPVQTIWRILIALAVILLLAQFFGALAARLSQPKVVGEIVTGLVLGPSVLGALSPSAVEWLLPPDVLQHVTLLGTLGLCLFMFNVGAEFDHTDLKRQAGGVLPVAAALMLVPLAAGSLVAYPWSSLLSGPTTSTLAYVLFVGTAMSVTAFPLLARIVTETGLTGTRLGSLAMLCAALSDVLAWCALALTMALAHAGGLMGALPPVLLTVLLTVAVLGVARPALARLVAAAAHRSPLVALTLAGILALIFGLAAVTELLGVHAIFGAFLAGLVLPRDRVHVSDIPERLDSLNRALLLPVYFTVMGMQVDVRLLTSDAALLGVGAVLFLVAVLTKLGTAVLIGFTGGLSLREAAGFGVLMNTRGVTEIVVLGAGLAAGIITSSAFTVLVLMAIVTTVAAVPLLSWLGLVSNRTLRPRPPQLRRRSLAGLTPSPRRPVGPMPGRATTDEEGDFDE